MSCAESPLRLKYILGWISRIPRLARAGRQTRASNLRASMNGGHPVIRPANVSGIIPDNKHNT